ncbi:MAG: phosphorylase, partial [Gammaproteobacteria bacterium]|nr:phosphorylase [Gammaproteobacteria bacterium]NIO62375.1 phosphorylase [Gammaproteobacteria bacterium]
MNHLGIITALLSEARCFHKHPQLNEPLKISDNISLIVSGIGQHAAHTAANKLVHAGADALLCTGFAGALSDHLEAGDLILPATVNTETGKK